VPDRPPKDPCLVGRLLFDKRRCYAHIRTDILEVRPNVPRLGRREEDMSERVSDGVVGFLLGVAFMLILIQIWGLSWVRFLAPSWKPGV